MTKGGALKSTYIVNDDGIKATGGRWALQCGKAIKVRGFTVDSIGDRMIKGGDALPIYVLEEDDIRERGGDWMVEAGQPIQVTDVIDAARGVIQGHAIVVYPVDANGNYDPTFAIPYYDFNLGLMVFTPFMAKRAGQGPFAAAPIVQGDWDGSGVPDNLNFPQGNLIGNQTQLKYANFDPYQGSIVFWWTPEKDRDVTQTNDESLFYISGSYKAAYEHDNGLIRFTAGGQDWVTALNTVAGTTYCICLSWDTNNKIDGTNYFRISINDTHSFGEATQPTISASAATMYIGSIAGTSLAANAIIEGLTIYRRPLTDGTYGVRPQNGNQYSNDEINAIWAAGAGRDPTLVTGSEDVCFCLPTDSTEEILATGTGEAWSWPWEDNLLDVWGAWDGGLPGTDRAVEFNATTTVINCGSDVDIDDIHDAEMTVEVWVRVDSDASDGFIISKGGVAGLTVGWALFVDDTFGIRATVQCAGTDATAIPENVPAQSITNISDGKWHHVVMHWDDANVGAARVISLAFDGVWITDWQGQVAGVGAVVTDVGEDLFIGRDTAGTRVLDGAIAWAAISNNDRHTVGTDFIPPRAFPADDANYLASWPMDEGTGVAIDNIGNQGGAGSGAANRDGVLANGSWSSIWEQDATPVIPQSVESDGTTTIVAVPDNAAYQDLADNAFTAEGWVRSDGAHENNTGPLFEKGATAAGWSLILIPNSGITGTVSCATTDAVGTAYFVLPIDKRWHHVAMQYNDAGDRKVYLWVDGVPVSAYVAQVAGVGAIVTDVGEEINMISSSWGGWCINGAVGGWTRISDIARYTNGEAFVPDARTSPPGLPDANSVWQTDYSDGAGTTLTDDSATGVDGVITFGGGQWRTTPDMEIDEPGAAIYGPKGYNLGVDAALEGTYIEQIVVASTDYVVFPVLSIGESGRGRPRIRVRDMTGAADVVIFNGPMFYGTHTGGNASANLIPTVPRWIADALIGATAYNITDGSSAVISDNTELIATTALAGGVGNLWDNGDVFVIRFPRGYCERPWQESFCFQTPAGCVLLRVYIENVNAEGVMQIHQVQVLPNLLVNGDHESLTGANPDIITGWVNNGLDAGDTESSAGSAGIIHSGAEAMEWNVGAISGEDMSLTIAGVTGFVASGAWLYADGTVGINWQRSGANLVGQDGTTILVGSILAAWVHAPLVWLVYSDPFILRLRAETGAGADRFTDDVYAVLLDDVTLTVTPASQANSLEASGIRIDGRDTSDQPVTALRNNIGAIRCNARPRHSTALAAGFGQTDETIFDCYEDANNLIRCYRSTNSVFVQYNANGAGMVTNNWNSTGLWNEDVDVEIVVQYGAFGTRLYVDGVLRLDVPGAIVFATDFTQDVNWGHRFDGTLQFDGVIS